MSCRADTGKIEKRRLGEFDIEGVDFLGADVAGEERGLPRAYAGPGARAKLAWECADLFQVDDAIELGIADAKPKVSRVRCIQSVKVNVRAILRPGHIPD